MKKQESMYALAEVITSYTLLDAMDDCEEVFKVLQTHLPGENDAVEWPRRVRR